MIDAVLPVLIVFAVASSAAFAADSSGPPPPARPHLFFTPADVDSLRAKCAGAMKPQFDEIARYAVEHLADVPPAQLEGDNEQKGLQIEHPFLTNVLNFSFLYVVTGEPKYLDAAKRWTLGLAALPEWEGKVVPSDKEADRGLYTGFGLTGLAAGYDWLYNSLTEDERRLVRTKIASRSEAIYRATSHGEWWSRAYLHHDLWIPVAGMGLGAVAVMDEVPDARTWALRAEEEFAEALRRLGDDGAWHEGPCGWTFAMASFVPFWDAYNRKFGARFDSSKWLQETWRFRLYSRTPDGQFLSFGDGRATGNYQQTGYQAAPALRFLARKFVNPYAQWLAAEEWSARPNPYTAVWEIIWADTAIAARPPYDLPLSMLFANEGLAILRTGWHIEHTVAAFHCDSLVGEVAARFYQNGDDGVNTAVDHAHADANTLAIWSRGRFALTAAGYGQRDTRFQNSLLVDGQGQYRSFDRKERPGRPKGVINRFFSSRFASLVDGEAAACYPPGLAKYTRRIFVVHPGVVFISDSVAAEKEVLPEWMFHVPKESATVTGVSGFESYIEKIRTTMKIAAPRVATITASENERNKAVHVTAPKRGKEFTLFAAILPSYSSDLGATVDSPTESSLVVETPEWKVLAAFAPQGGKFELPGRLTGDGLAGVAMVAGPERGFLAVDSTSLSVDGVKVLSAPVPVTVSVSVWIEAGEITVSCGEPTQLAIDPGMSVRDVTKPGGRSVPHLNEGPRLILNVPEGASTYTLVAGQPSAAEGN